MEVLEEQEVEGEEVLEAVEVPCPALAEVRRRLMMRQSSTHHGNTETGGTQAPGPDHGLNLSTCLR